MNNMETLKTVNPIARKEHTCDYCGCKICVGERYERATILFEGTIYDWVSHECCSKITHELKMFDGYDGLNSEEFRENINEYVSEFHYDDELDDISKDWQLPYHELVKKVLEELKKEKSNE